MAAIHEKLPKFCAGCGYNLHGLTSNQCPECGRTFDPKNPLTYKLQRKKRWNLRSGSFVLGLFVAVSAGHLLLNFETSESWEHHPYSGPLIAMYLSSSLVDFVTAVAIFVPLSVGICLPAFKANGATFVVCGICMLLWFAMSMSAAYSAAA